MTLAFGPMKPVGLPDPRTGHSPLRSRRQDDRHANLYNLVGFQTKLTYPEQRRIFCTIPGLGDATFGTPGQHAPQHLHQCPRLSNQILDRGL